MSVEPTTLERSALERKDREELTTIAQALGAKPRARARKAEIVQLILEVTGVDQADAVPEGGVTVSDDDKPATSAETSEMTPATPDVPTAAAGNGGLFDDAATGTRSGPGEAKAAGDQGTSAPVAAAPADAPKDAGLAGTTGPSEAPGEADASPSPSTSGSDAAPAKDEGGAARSGGSAPAKDEGEAATSRDGAPAKDEGEAATSGDSAPAKSEGAAARSGDAGSTRSPRHQDGGGRKGDGRQGRAEQRNGQRGDGQKSDGRGSGGDQGDGESGNRRRRRRGRNRESGGGGQAEEFSGDPVEVEGLLDLRDEGYGFLRVRGSLPSKDDIYVSVKQVRQFGLRKGDVVVGASRSALRNEKNPALLRIDKVNGVEPDEARKRRRFEDLTPLFPDEKLRLEMDDPGNMTARIIDLISPIGKGQRGLIVSPPKAGKTTIVKQIVRSIEVNNPEVKLLVLLVDERPEEVTDMRRWLRNPTSEVVASTFDRPADEHALVAELTIERAKRLVEDEKDVCIVLDGITRLARAYNLAAPATGRIMSGGVDSGALYPPKKFFGAARNVEEGGSLTILATALIETGSKMDEVIFEEFKGTGNMELRLDRRLAERRIYPAIDVDASSTRHEELLFPRNQLNLVWALRRVLSGLSSSSEGGGNGAALELLTDRMKTFRTNDEFLAEVAKNRLAAG
jgi:transcription termination factor Rho